MSLTNNTKLNVVQQTGVVPELALAEPGANLAEAIPVTMTNNADNIDMLYSATAEDNGTAGIVDGQPGLIYSGPNGNYFRVAVANVDTLEHAITAPEATDKAALAIFKNSEVQAYGDEGFNEHDAEVAVENNVDTLVGPFNEGDVLRVGFVFSGEVDADLDVAPGEITVT